MTTEYSIRCDFDSLRWSINHAQNTKAFHEALKKMVASCKHWTSEELPEDLDSWYKEQITNYAQYR